jgi:heterotetrameric sarcosine oxidase gamma subunit
MATDPVITILPPAPLCAMEVWSNPGNVAARFESASGLPLPPMGRWVVYDGMTLIRFEPTVWLVEGDTARLENILGDGGALTAIGGGIVRIRIAGPGWRTLLMEGGAFDAESDTFASGCAAATIIDHVAVRLMVEDKDACLAYVPASYASGIVRFWRDALSPHTR